MAEKKGQGRRVWENKPIEEPKTIPASREPGKYHVDLYLKVKGVPLHERGGKRAFAVKKGLAFGTDKDFDELFKSY